MPPYATTMTEYHHHSATDIYAARPLDSKCDAAGSPHGRHETGDIDVIRYTMSSLQLDETHWSNPSPPHGGLAGMGHRSATGLPKQKHAQSAMRHVSADSTLKCAGVAPRAAYAAAAVAAAATAPGHHCRPASPKAEENTQLAKAAIVLQRAFRAKKHLEQERKAAAAVKIQATFRSYRSRLEVRRSLCGWFAMRRSRIDFSVYLLVTFFASRQWASYNPTTTSCFTKLLAETTD
ncbi:hypothetical protein HDU87_004650 [Geranomyces variabilis]|uniref:Uncharacterized protein n=1 Tax=Geranomyces variabilis TaxID=109894 RepID=A0AAD5TI59_9FUNG|nr:hypothetical protein HDU87_004650 [Geranomyces variabilis]